MPNSLRVKESIAKVKNIVYFGLYENETSEIANLIIPAKSFLYKNDVRTSYSHHSMMFMNQIEDSTIGISEYDLSAYLSKEFKVELKDENFYIEHFKSFADREIDEIPYKDGFDTDDGEFIFIEEFDTEIASDDKFFLITPKSPNSLNSQFKRDDKVYLHPSLGFSNDEIVTISSEAGSVKLKVQNCDDLREDCVLIHSGTKGVNNLTSSKHSYEGKNAIYQENKVEVNR